MLFRSKPRLVVQEFARYCFFDRTTERFSCIVVLPSVPISLPVILAFFDCLLGSFCYVHSDLSGLWKYQVLKACKMQLGQP